MFRKNATRAAVLVTVAALGAYAAALVAPTKASAYSPYDLINMGYSTRMMRLSDGCHDWQIGLPGKDRTDIGSDCDPNFQANLDAYENDTFCYLKPLDPTCIPTVTVTTSETTTQTETTTETATVAAPPVTVTTPPETVPAPPPVTTTVIQQEQLPAPPVAGFTVAVDGLNVTLTDTSGAAEVCWQYGDGDDGCGATVSHDYAAAGAYNVFETVVAGDGLSGETAQAVIATDVSVWLRRAVSR